MKNLKNVSKIIVAILIGVQSVSFAGDSSLLLPNQQPSAPTSAQSPQEFTKSQTQAETLVSSKNELQTLSEQNNLRLAATNETQSLPQGMVYIYDANGRLIIQRQYTAQSQLTCEINFTYNTQGALTQTGGMYYDLYGQLILKVISNFNAAGQVYSQFNYNSSWNLTGEMHLTYDASGVLTQSEDISYDSLGQVARKLVSYYDAYRRLTNQTLYNGAGAVGQKTNFTYVSGRLSQREDTFYDTSGRPSNRLVFTHDANERLTGWKETTYSYAPQTNNYDAFKNAEAFRYSIAPIPGDPFYYNLGKEDNYLFLNEYKYTSRLNLTDFMITSYTPNPAGDITFLPGTSEWIEAINKMITKTSNALINAASDQKINVELTLDTLYEIRAMWTGSPTGTLTHYYNSHSVLLQSDEFDLANRLKLSRLYTSTGELYHYVTYNVYTGLASLKEWYFVSDSLIPPVTSRRVQYNDSGTAVQITAFDSAGNITAQFDPSTIGNPFVLDAWFSQNQLNNGTGLITSHPDEPGFIYHEGVPEESKKIYANTQAYTYDQALAGIAALNENFIYCADQIFNFFYSEWQADPANFSGFWTVYNVDPAYQWKKYEWRKGMGENAWIALFCLEYSNLSPDAAQRAKGLELATAIAKWIGTLPHKDGGVAMSPDNPTGNPNYGRIYSVENNLDYYAILKALTVKAISGADKSYFQNELDNLKNWLKTQAYDPATGLFRRGGYLSPVTNQLIWDNANSLDVNSWAITAIGPATLKDDFGIDLDDFRTRISYNFAVQDDGSFGGDLLTAKGFDFSDPVNAGLIGRTGIKWVEGTNQMILAYQTLADFYSATDRVKSSYYQSLADYFLSRNPENALPATDTLSYVYADQTNIQIYYDSINWRTFPGQAAASVGWAYFALKRMNPFDII